MTLIEAIRSTLSSHLEPRAAASVISTLSIPAGADVGAVDLAGLRDVLAHLEAGLTTFGCRDKPRALAELRRAITAGKNPGPVRARIMVRGDGDVLSAQRQCQTLVGGFFRPSDCVRLATAVSELARNIYLYAKSGEVLLELTPDGAGVRFSVTASDKGPGIPHLDEVLNGHYVSHSGLGRGLKGTRALLDGLEVETRVGAGTTVRGHKRSVRA